jgi:hypothetical protein
MENIRVFHAKAIGESHIKKNMPCQDATGSFEDHDKQIYIGVVSDGHGSKDYFRSDKGAQLLVDITIQAIKDFMKQSEAQILFQSHFTSRNTVTSGKGIESSSNQNEANKKQSDEALNQIFKYIISKWRQSILEDWSESTPCKEELESYGVSETMISDFLSGDNLPTAYGCTLMAFAKAKDYWFAFQIGDGKSIAFDNEMNAIEPIPTDELCMGSVTTSMCEENAFSNFRYAYGNDIPAILFIGSDGMDGYFSTVEEYAIEPLKNLYRSLAESFLNNGFDEALKDLIDSLPILTKRGVAQDDMSIAGWIDFGLKDSLLKGIVESKKKQAEKKLIETEKKLHQDHDELKMFENNIVQKTFSMNELEVKLLELKKEYDTSKINILAFEQKIKEEQERQKVLKTEKENIISKKEKLRAELDDINWMKENKVKNIQKAEEDKNSTKSIIKELGEKVSKFLGVN